jgi:hypothetical protein
MVGEIALGLAIDGRQALSTLIGEATRLLVMAGLLWAAGDIAVLMIDAGHDLRVSRILLGRINARLQQVGGPREEPASVAGAVGEAASGPPALERRTHPSEQREPALPGTRPRRS